MISHTDLVSQATIKRLAIIQAQPAVSIIIPTSPTDVLKAPIQLSNAVAEAEKHIQTASLDSSALQEQFNRLEQLRYNVQFWRYQGQSLAIYITADSIEAFRLPVHSKYRVVVNSAFYLRPLFDTTQGTALFYILALSQNRCQLYAATPDSISQLFFEPLPTMEQELFYLDDEKQLQFHTQAASVHTPGGSARPAVFFGHAEGNDRAVEKERIAEYFIRLDRIVTDILPDQRVPLILGGTEYLQPIYRECSRYAHILDEGIKGNLEQLNEKDILLEAQKIMHKVVESQIESEIVRYEETGDRELILDTVQEILPAAHFGAIDTLFLADNAFAWAAYDAEEMHLEVAKEPGFGFGDLYDTAARATFLNGGQVLVLPRDRMPKAKPMTAILRFPYKLPPMRSDSRERGDHSRPDL